MDVAVLGPIRVVAGGRDLTPAGARQRRALVALVQAGHEGASGDRLAEIIWDDDDRPLEYGPHLRTVINRLRRQLRVDEGAADPIVTRPGGYGLDDEVVDVDAWRFAEIAASAADELDPVRRGDVLADALGVWRGEPFDEVGGLPQLASTIAGLTDLRLTAEEDLLDALLEQGRPDRALARVQPLLDEHPYRERLRRVQVLALYRLGRQTDAIRALHRHRERMIDELGVTPSPDLDEIEQLVLRQDPSLSGPAGGRRALRGYRLSEIVGSGTDSVVYRAWQPTLDRPVAIKVIRADLVNDPTFIRRFEREAAVIARLEHPFIVPLYDYWREPGQAFLVSRLLSRSLADAIAAEGAWSPDRVVTLVEQIGAALTLAHGVGVVHRDVKPANILLDEHGNAYLVDFGIASVHDVALDAIDEPDGRLADRDVDRHVDRHLDVAGLATVAVSALTGSLAPVADVRAALAGVDLPTDAIELLAANVHAQPMPIPTVAELVDRISAAVAGPHHPTSRAVAAPAGVPTPYRGLLPFEAADERFFVGREEIVAEMGARWSAGDRLLVLTGASGVGKSSVARAGFLPALGRGDVDGSDRWFVATMTPGADPFAALAEALAAVATRADADPHRALRHGERPIAGAIRETFGAADAEVVVFIDQFEELSSIASTESAHRFTGRLAEALDDDTLRLRVVATLRADFFSRPLETEEFGRHFRSSIVPVGPLDAAALEAAVTVPSAAVGVRCDPALVATLVADVSQNPLALPLLQLTLTELFAHRTFEGMTLAAYEELGGLSGALIRRGETLVDSLDDADAARLRTMFGQLANLDGAHGPVRRRVPLSSLIELGVTTSVVERAASSRLVVLDRDVRSRAPTVEVTHESVLSEWPRLAAWLERDRELLAHRAMLTRAAEEWDRDGRDDSGLLRGRRLDAAEETADTVPIPALVQALVDVSRSRRAADQQRERVRRRRLIATTVVAVVVAIAAVVAGGVALRLRGEARGEAARALEQQERADEAAARAAESQGLAEDRAAEAAAAAEAERSAAARADEAARLADAAAAEAESAAAAATTAALARSAQAIAATQPVLARQLAVAAFDRSDEPATRQALASTLTATPGLVRRVATLGEASCEAMSTGSGPVGAALALAPDADGPRLTTVVDLVSGAASGPLDVSSAVSPGTIRNTSCPQPNASGSAMLVSTDEEVALVHEDGTSVRAEPLDLVAWTNDQQAIVGVATDVATGVQAELRVHADDDLRLLTSVPIRLGHPEGIPADIRATGADGLAIVADGSHRAVVVDLASGDQRYLNAFEDPDERDFSFTVDISDDGGVAVGLGYRVMTVWQLDGDADVFPATAIEPAGSPYGVVGTTGPAPRPVLSPTGARVALITSAGVEVFDIASGEPVSAPIEVAVSAGAVRFVDDGLIAVLTAGGELLHHDLGRPSALASTMIDGVPGGLVASDGSTFTATIGDPVSRRWVVFSLADGGRTDHGDASVSSKLRVSSVGGDVVVRFDVASGEYERLDGGIVTQRTRLADRMISGIEDLGQAIRVEHGTVLLILRSKSNIDNPTGQVIALDFETGRLISALDIPDVRRVELISADEFVHGDFEGGVTVRSIDGKVVDSLPSFASSVQSFAGSRTGDLLLGLDDGTTLVWSRVEARILRDLSGPPETVISVHEAADGTIVVQHLSGRIVVWWPDSDVLGAELLGPVGFTGLAQVIDDRVVVAAAGRVLEIPLDVAAWRSVACGTAGDEIDPVRWRAAVGSDPPQPRPCS
jgi:DNA-binding SARP family transcriptional activator/tRNA A-37 threonylcarbamoyl transferase component Bud32